MRDALGLRVLVIEDDRFVRTALRHVLRAIGCTVREADHGAAALELLGAGDTAFDVLLLDLNMPVMDGATFYEELGRRHPELVPRVVICTGGGSSTESRRFLARVGSPVLLQPIVWGDLERALRPYTRVSHDTSPPGEAGLA